MAATAAAAMAAAAWARQRLSSRNRVRGLIAAVRPDGAAPIPRRALSAAPRLGVPRRPSFADASKVDAARARVQMPGRGQWRRRRRRRRQRRRWRRRVGGRSDGSAAAGTRLEAIPLPDAATPRLFAHCLQHLDLVCHEGLALPLQPRVGSLGQTSPCESSRPRFGSSASPAAGDWGRMPAPKTAGSQCGGQATPEATLEATPDEQSTMLVRRSTLITAPTRAKARRTMSVWKKEVCVTDASPSGLRIQLQICTPHMWDAVTGIRQYSTTEDGVYPARNFPRVTAVPAASSFIQCTKGARRTIRRACTTRRTK